ncbi:FTR1 family iron permease [Brackiella oedipodis]|uniref:FTR1 family iron permease n=1 Tax=Brackiella oedipodis TaxID=124225 RepID=UPI000688C348|nr:FTR1 family protein [Brackiella oedipodis]
MDSSVLFIVWRESIEALLVIGILYSWLNRHPDGARGKKYLGLGVIGGILLAVMLALSLYGTSYLLSPEANDIFIAVLTIFASILIVQMVLWMSKNSKMLKKNLENDLNRSYEKSSWLGVAIIAAIAIAREGSEIVIFLSAEIAALTSDTTPQFILTIAVGIVLALLSFLLLQVFNHFIAWKFFFKITAILLLFLGSSLFLQGVLSLADISLENEYLIEHDIMLPDWLFTQVWDTSGILSDDSAIGSLLTSFFAYRSKPTYLVLITLAVYWIIVLALFARSNRNSATPKVTHNHTEQAQV